MKKFYIFLIALFIINGAMAQGSVLALSINALAQSKHPTFRSNEIVRDGMHNTGMKISNLNSEMNLGKIIKPQPHRPQDLIQIYDSVYQWQWDTTSVGWIIASKIINIVYDAQHNMTSYIEKTWTGSFWMNFDQYTFTYDAHNNMTSELYQFWNGSTWEDSSKNTYIYDANNNLTSDIEQSWNGSAWVNSLKDIYTYDASNNRTSELYQSWNGSVWVNSMQITNIYDANNNLTSLLWQFWISDVWENTELDTYTYDANNNLTSSLYQSWNGSSWENSQQDTYTYDANNNLTSRLAHTWNGSAWVNYLQSLFTYNANNNLISEFGQSWNGNAWVNYWQYLYNYDVDNFPQSYSYKDWNITGTKVTSGDSAYYYYHTVLGINDLMAQNGNLTVYPNPASTQITIETSTSPAQSQLSIMNLNGEALITRQITEPKTQIDISSLPNGVYFVRVTNDKTIVTGKIIKQ